MKIQFKTLSVLITTLFFALLSISAFNQSDIDAQKIIDKSIKKQNGKKVAKGSFSFDFRKYHYTYKRNQGSFEYTRKHKETGVKDILTNDGIKRMSDGKEVILTEKQKGSYSRSVNSVHYFTFLPYFLNDPAVGKELIGEAEIKGKTYHKIRVTFDQDGGGDDHDDIYIYWIDTDDYSLDYLAYSFRVNGGGVRFRSAYNPRKVGGVLFQDYVNFKHDKDTPVEDLDLLFDSNELIELSRIELTSIKKEAN